LSPTKDGTNLSVCANSIANITPLSSALREFELPKLQANAPKKSAFEFM